MHPLAMLLRSITTLKLEIDLELLTEGRTISCSISNTSLFTLTMGDEVWQFFRGSIDILREATGWSFSMQDAHARVSGSSDEESRPNLTFGQVTLQMPDKIIDALMPFSVSTITEAPWLAEPRSLSFSLPSGGEIALGNFRIRAVEESALQVCLWVEEGLPVLDLSLLSGAIVPVEFSAFAATSEIGSLGLLQLWSRTTAHVFDPLLDY